MSAPRRRPRRRRCRRGALAAPERRPRHRRGPVSIAVDARPGQVAAAAAGLRAAASRCSAARAGACRWSPTRAGRRRSSASRASRAPPATTAFADADPAVSQGLERSGADVLGRIANGGAGLTIAVLDLGFGQNLGRLQALGELPPPSGLETLSFDAAGGLAGTNAYGNRTNHGELVAQTVFDYAPAARYLFVNYHSDADFLAATDAIIARHPDIVVHSNSFIEGPFDGTSPGGPGGRPRRRRGHPVVQLGRQLRAAALVRRPGRTPTPTPTSTGRTATTGPSRAARACRSPSPSRGPPRRAARRPISTSPSSARARDGPWSVVATSADRQSQGARPPSGSSATRRRPTGLFRLRAAPGLRPGAHGVR